MTKKGSDIYLEPLSGEHKYTVIWLHGLGQSAESYLQYVSGADPMIPNQNTKVVLLTAPKIPVSIKGGAVINAWYDICAS